MRGRAFVAGMFVVAAATAAQAQTVPPGFTDTLVTSVSSPTALAFTPDGRMIITTQSGTVRVYQGGSLSTALTFPTNRICTDSERGALGVAVDPSFPSNNFVYIYYTAETPTGSGTCKNRVSRFTLPGSNVIDIASELILIDQIHSTAGNHNGGDVHFGRDGFLYVSVGDGGCDYAGGGCAGSNDAARDRHVMLGKILRITSAGGIPAGNPFTGANSGRCNVTGTTTAGNWCQETFAWGLRNPFRIAFDEDDPGTRFFINDVGQGAREEIDLGQAGADYGWNCREGTLVNNTSGPCSPTPPNMVPPIHEYDRGIGGAITGGAFVPNGVWPAAYDSDYMFADYVSGRMFSLRPNGSGGYNRIDFGSGFSGPTHLRFGPFGATRALYYAAINSGQIRRIVSTTNQNPIAVMNASPTSGPAPLTVNFDGSGSSDPDGDPLTYIWDFGDGSPQPPSSATVSHTYGVGSFTASLRVQDNRVPPGISNPVTVVINSGNTPPTPTITAPTSTARFRVGQAVTLVGSATDAQEGTLPPSALSWRVVLHHATHTHPFLGPVTGNNIPFTAPAPEDLAAAANSYLEIILTATDSNNGSTTISQNFLPNAVNLTFATNPAGLLLGANGTTFVGPQTVVSWEAYVLNVHAPNQVDGSGNGWAFSSWSDGGAASHAITTPAAPATYTATFVASPVLTVSSPTVAEGNSGTSNATFTVALSNTPAQTVTVDYGTSNGTATAGSDYTAVSGGLSFTTASSQTVNVSVNGDQAFEGNETILLGLTNAVGAAVANTGVATIRTDDWQGADFNNDGRTDILWRHEVSGEQVVWRMNGTALTSGTFTTPPGPADLRWKVVGTSHFNGDGKTDILFRHDTTGGVVAWFMDGETFVGGGPTSPAAVDPIWKTVATGDFNSDGKGDILFRHDLSGELVMWFMDGLTISGAAVLTPVVSLGWKVVGTGDFNGDGKTDILWWHSASGQIVVWFMDGATVAGGTLTSPSAVPDTNWRIVGVGDFNVDAKSDLLWRHQISGQNVVWHMDGVTLQGGTFTTPSALADLNWRIVGPR